MQETVNCDLCQGEILTKTNQLYHYVESGLVNIYLTGISVEECQKCGDVSPWLPKLNKLHRTIARAIVMQPSSLAGQEIRFLRTERALKAKDFATLLSVDPVTLSRWENSQQQPSSQNDSFIRTIYVVLFSEQMHQLFPDSLVKILETSTNDSTVDNDSTLGVNNKKIIIINLSNFSYSYQHSIPLAESVLAS